MNPIAECCADAVAFSYRSMDRLVLNAYIPTLQTPAAMAVFFRQVQRKPILAGKVFKDLTDRFVADVMHFAEQRRIPVLRVNGRTRPGEVAQKALKAAQRAGRFGVVGIVVHQESARVFASTHAGGRATNYRVKEDRRLVNHYYLYLRDKDYGEGFVRRSSYPPFQTRIWMNAHGHLAAQLGRHDPVAAVDRCGTDFPVRRGGCVLGTHRNGEGAFGKRTLRASPPCCAGVSRPGSPMLDDRARMFYKHSPTSPT